ncbi:hypothetical protein H4N58_00905 [Mumia sp. ZJ1417]|uniref:hypothetical protein n=1 Tax=Mumia sp. ZJ1417 TaxID=2708082 RepID=UPI0014209F7D|nr:hypothetical protein [Mumia sp. ZJ1417]QMW66581.1 hypothetical protein H4N58_00905 [Mumia sp. ZJ1417]
MPNPAKLLLDLLDSWEVPPNRSIKHARGFSGGELQAWQRHQLAAQWIAEIESSLNSFVATDDLDQVEAWIEQLHLWYAALFEPDRAWNLKIQEGLSPLSGSPRSMLRALIPMLDTAKAVPKSGAEQIAQLLAALADARKLVNESTYLNREVERYIKQLLDEAAIVAEEVEKYGEATLRARVFEVGGAMTALAEAPGVSEEEKSKWTARAKKILTVGMWTGYNAAVTMATQGAVAALPPSES